MRAQVLHALHSDLGIKEGQIAHLDRDPSNNTADNLAFLCLTHHDVYDTRRSQSKNFRTEEVKIYRLKLIDSLSAQVRPDKIIAEELERQEKALMSVSDAMHRCWNLTDSPTILSDEIARRLGALVELSKRCKAYSDPLDGEEFDDAAYWEFGWNTMQLLDIPYGVHNLPGQFEINEQEELEAYFIEFFEPWTRGMCSSEDCHKAVSYLDDELDIDLAWIIYGLPSDRLAYGGYKSLVAFFFSLELGTCRWLIPLETSRMTTFPFEVFRIMPFIGEYNSIP